MSQAAEILPASSTDTLTHRENKSITVPRTYSRARTRTSSSHIKSRRKPADRHCFTSSAKKIYLRSASADELAVKLAGFDCELPPTNHSDPHPRSFHIKYRKTDAITLRYKRSCTTTLVSPPAR